MTLSGQVALVTGASRGLGKAIAIGLAREGARVAVNYVARAAEADAVAAQIRSSGGTALAIRADVGNATEVESMVQRVSAELGPIAVLVNNAGVLMRGTLETFDESMLDRMQRIN